MIQMRTLLKVADNSGAKRIMCITPQGGGVGRTATVGDIISATVKEAEPESKIPKGKSCAGSYCENKERSPAQRRLLYSF